MKKLLFTDITFLQVDLCEKALKSMSKDGWSRPYELRIGPGVKFGPGTHKYLRDNKVSIV